MMGPIVRAKDFLPQIQKKPFVTKQQVGEGLYLITAGVIKKVIISDYINANFVRVIFDNPGMHTGIECLMAVYGYAMVIYCDFSGYSDMAIGMAKWVGFEINVNFLSPYQSASITEFWKRWHISLSSWLKDYLYIRWLGGNRKGKIRTKINLIITMLLGGFWHGASWNFITWGFIHACAFLPLLILNRNRKYLSDVVAQDRKWPNLKEFYQMIITFGFVTFAWLFFRMTNLSDAIDYLHKIATGLTHINMPTYRSFIFYPIILILLLRSKSSSILNQMHFFYRKRLGY